MIRDVMEFFGLEREFRNPGGFFETENSGQIREDLRHAIRSGHLIALTGLSGSGKTSFCREIRKELVKEKILVSTSIASEKDKIGKQTLIHEIFEDIKPNDKIRLPKSPGLRERSLRNLIRKEGRPVALFIDEAHDLHHKTLFGLKTLMEGIHDSDAVLSIILIGYQSLRIELRRPRNEPTGSRTTALTDEGIRGHEAEFFNWLLTQCLREDVRPTDIFDEEAAEILTSELHTPLQLIDYSWRSLVAAHEVRQKKVGVEIVRDVISEHINELDARLARLGYNAKVLSETTGVTLTEARNFINGKLDPEKAKDLQKRMGRIGITKAVSNSI